MLSAHPEHWVGRSHVARSGSSPAKGWEVSCFDFIGWSGRLSGYRRK